MTSTVEHKGSRNPMKLGIGRHHGFLFCLMHAIFEQFTTAKLWELEHYKQDAREGAINSASVFRNTVKDAERSKK